MEADGRHRLHHLEGRKRWQRFFEAADENGLHEGGYAVVERLRADHEIVYLTGRPVWLEDVTLAWLDANGLGGHRLEMRPDHDRRPAAQVKVDRLRRLAAGRTVGVVVDVDERALSAMAPAGHPPLPPTRDTPP